MKISSFSATKVKEYLRYDFTPDELRKMGLDMANAAQKVRVIDDQFKAAKENFKDKIAKEELIVKQSSWHISQGFEMRDIECEKLINYKKGIVTFTRLDTGEVVEERDIRDEERQMKIVERMIQNERIQINEIATLFSISRQAALKEMKKLIEMEVIDLRGSGRGAYYVLT